MTDDLAAWVTQIWDEQEWWATEASRSRGGHTPTGEHWHWVCGNDHVIEPTPLTDEVVECSQCDAGVSSLRSVEEYPTTSGVGPLPNFAIYCEEVGSTVAGHIIRNDPASVLARIAADRQILGTVRMALRTHPAATPTCPNNPDCACRECITVRLLALPHADRPGYQEAWRPVSPS